MPVKSQGLYANESSLGTYAGLIATVSDYYLLRKGTEAFYIYSMRIGDGQKEIILHEDELESFVQ